MHPEKNAYIMGNLAGMKLKKGVLIVFEGIDGSGKTTQARALMRRLQTRGWAAVFLREPSKGKWGREIKRKAAQADSLTAEEELALFVKDRRENVEHNLKPALFAGKIVVLDRYYFSTMAYQGARGIDPQKIRRMNEKFAVKPDLVFVLDIAAGTGLGRIQVRKSRDELFEKEDYLVEVRKIFQCLKGRRFVHIDGWQDRREIGRIIWTRVEKLLRGRTKVSS